MMNEHYSYDDDGGDYGDEGRGGGLWPIGLSKVQEQLTSKQETFQVWFPILSQKLPIEKSKKRR